jgi:glycyl-tRNA synthetase
LNPQIAPVKAAVFPLQKDEKLTKVARELFLSLKKQYVVEYDNRGNIGKMYRRQDEIGTPYCITIDYQTLEDNTVTIRDRDTMKQERIQMSAVNDVIVKRITNF